MEETNKEGALKLRDEVAKQYDVKPGKVRKFYSAKLRSMVDLNEVTLAAAKRMEEAGYLVKKTETKSLKADNK